MDTKPRRIKLCDDVYLNVIRTDKFKTNFLTFFFLTDLTKRSASYCRLISRMLPRGTAKYPTARLLSRAFGDCYGASCDAFAIKHGESQGICVSLSTLADKFSLDGKPIISRAIDLATEMIFSPAVKDGGFDDKVLDGEKNNVKDAISAEINNKGEYARKRMIQIMCENEAYSVNTLGYPDIIDEVNGKQLYEYYRAFLSGARTEIYFAGICDEALLESKLKTVFSSVERRPVKMSGTVIISDAERVKRVTEKMDMTQSHLVMGFRTGVTMDSPDFVPFMLYNSVLGGSLTSKLFMNLREKMSLCYTVGSSPDGSKGIMRIYAGIDSRNSEKAINETFRQMKLIEDGEITDDEIKESKSAIINSLVGLGDNPGALAGWYLPRALCGDFDETPETLAAKVKALEKKDVIACARLVKTDTVYLLEGNEKENGADIETEENDDQL